MQRTDLEKLIAEYNNNKGWGRKLLNHPAIRALNSLLEKKVQLLFENKLAYPENLNDYDVVKCFHDNPTEPGHVSHSIYLRILGKTFSAKQPEQFAKFFARLHSTNDWNKNLRYVFDALKENPGRADIIWALHILHLAKLDSKQIVKAAVTKYKPVDDQKDTSIASHKDPRAVAEALYHLYCKGLLTNKLEHYKLICTSAKPRQMAEHIERLSKEVLPADFPSLRFKRIVRDCINVDVDCTAINAALQHPQRNAMLSIIFKLNKADILNEDNIAIVVNHSNLEALVGAMNQLDAERPLIYQSSFSLCAQHQSPKDAADYLSRVYTCVWNDGIRRHDYQTGAVVRALFEKNILTLEYALLIHAHKKPFQIAKALISLHDQGALNPENVQAACQQDGDTSNQHTQNKNVRSTLQ